MKTTTSLRKSVHSSYGCCWFSRERRVPGWSVYVEPSRENFVLWHRICVEYGRPKTETVADVMCRTRALYHYAVRRVKQDEQVLVRQRFADALLNNYLRDLGPEVKRIHGKKAMPAGVMDLLSMPESISDFFVKTSHDL